MNFLNPAVLFAAFAALIPLVIHLFSRRKVRTIEFSSLKHLKEMQRRQVRRIKIRQLLLLLLRMLIILALTLAFARPTTEGGGSSSDASASAVILLDNSASMSRYVSDGVLMELARKSALEVMSAFGQADEVVVIPLAQNVNDAPVTFGTSARARERIEQLQSSEMRANLTPALARAATLLSQARNANRELYLVSDRQRISFPDSAEPLDTGIRVFQVVLPSEGNDNVGVTDVSFGGAEIAVGQDADIIATVRNYGAQTRDQIVASLYLNGIRVAQTEVTVPAGEIREARFTFAPVRGGRHDGYVELSDDPLMADNRRYFSITLPERINVLVVGDTRSARLVELALAPAGLAGGYLSVQQTSSASFGLTNLFEYDVLVFAPPPADPAIWHRIEQGVAIGKSALFLFDLSTRVESFPPPAQNLTGIRITENAPTNVSRSGFYTLDNIDRAHPIFSLLADTGAALPELKFFTLPRVEPFGGARVAARFSGNRPALIDQSYGRGRVLTFVGSLDPDQSDLATQSFFVPFMNRSIEYLGASLSSYDLSLDTETPVVRAVAPEQAVQGVVRLLAPDSTIEEIVPSDEGGSILIRPLRTSMAGIYSLVHEGSELDRFAVNLRAEEGDLAEAGETSSWGALGASSGTLLRAGESMVAQIQTSRIGRELWHYFLWLAALFLAVEMLLSRGAPKEE